MKKPCRLVIYLALLLFALPVHGAQPKPRLYTGSGLLIIRPPTAQGPDTSGTLVLYREPGVGRVVEPAYGELPLLRQVMEIPDGEYPVAVMGKKGLWLKIAYDEAGRSGWVEMARHWEYVPWEEYLSGRTARFLPWLKKGHYLLRRDPSPAARELDTLTTESSVRIGRVEGDWMLVTVDLQAAGWLRWRDEDGRFLIAIRPACSP